jgi:hypothetical protein
MDVVHVEVPRLIQHDGQHVYQDLNRFFAVAGHLDEVCAEIAVVVLLQKKTKHYFLPYLYIV